MWDLSSLTRNQTILPTAGAQSLNHWMTWEVPGSVQFSSVAQSCPSLCDPMDFSLPGFPVHHQLLKLAQTHVHRIGDAVQPSHPLSSPFPWEPHEQYGSFYFWQKQENNTTKKGRCFQCIFLRQLDNQYGKIVTVNPYLLTPCTKVTWRWLMDLNIKAKTIKLLGENIGFFCVIWR